MKLTQKSSGFIDLQTGPHGIVIEDTLQSAIIVSLLTDRRAEPDDQLPTLLQPGSPLPPDRRGWAGDALSADNGFRLGSRLWLLKRAKKTEDTRKRAIFYCREALQWMIDDGVATAIDIAAAWAPVNDGWLMVDIRVTKPDGGYYQTSIKIGEAYGI